MQDAPRTPLVIASTFTADDVVEPLRFWMQRLAIPSSIELAPWGQLFQTLLDRSGPFFTNTAGINIAIVRISDLGQTESDVATAADDLAAAMRAAAAVVP